MANTFIQPLYNPFPLFQQGATTIPQHLTRYFDEWQMEDRIKEWEQRKEYSIPYQTNDSIRLQFQSNYSPLSAKLIHCNGREYELGNLDAVRASVDRPGFHIYEGNFPLDSYPEGKYVFQLSVGSPASIVLISPRLNIKESHPNTVLLEYTNYRFKDEIIFETGFSPSRRVHGDIRFKTPARKDTLFEDQPLNQSLIKSLHYRVWQFTLGSVLGVPDFEIDLMDRIFGCSDVQIDGRYFTISDGRWEPTEEQDYPLRGWKIELRERYNKAYRGWENDNPVTGQMGAVINVDSKGFGNSSGSQVISINDVN